MAASLVGIVVSAGIFVFLDVPPVRSSSPPAIQLQPSSINVDPNLQPTYQVNIVAQGVAELGAFEFEFVFDPVALKLLDVSAGPFLASTGRTVLCQERPIREGLVEFACVSLSPEPAGPSGSGVLAVATLKGRAAGVTHLSLQGVILTDISGLAYPPPTLQAGAGAWIAPMPSPTMTLTHGPLDGPVVAPASMLGPAGVFKEPGGTNLFLGAGPLTVSERVVNVPAGPGLGAFDLHVTYDATYLSVEISEGPFLSSTEQTSTCLRLIGLGQVRLSCSIGAGSPGPVGSGVLGFLTVRPVDGLRLRAAPQNGIDLVLDDFSPFTRLFDTVGNPIPLEYVGDARVGLRALEGDINSDCTVNVVDQQTVAGRVGVTVGSILYSPFFDLEPALPDGDIDFSDLQVVSGRLGSTCQAPQSPQMPPSGKATPTPKPPTPTSTHTPTPTATPTPTPVPGVQKLPPLQNLFLTRQGAKIPPSTCLASTDVATLTESLTVPVRAPDPKDPSQAQQLGAFSFEVRFNSKQMCVELRKGTAAANMTCTIQDAVTDSTLQNVARIGCVTLGKVGFPDTMTPAGRELARLLVRPQPELYSQIRAGQGNGVALQLLDQDCKLADLQGGPIAVASCEDADVTIRFLEGDVEPNCRVDAADTQAIAFRWGSTKGKLLFNHRFDLMPAHPTGFQGDDRLDVNDLQFVFGRFGSTCAAPWPAQPPVKPKA